MIGVILVAALMVPCHAGGSAAFPTPDNSCSPGAYDRLTVREACTPGKRRSTPVAVRRTVLARYGVPGWSGRDGEIDHRVPDWAGGKESVGNLWPERGPIPNRKDRLESYARLRVCVDGDMRLRTARRLFLSEWPQAWEFYEKRGWPR